MTFRDGNLPFKLGFGIGMLLFIVANLAHAAIAASEFAERDIKFAHGGYSWGFPLPMYHNFLGNPNNIGFELVPTAINIIIAGVSAGVLGIVLQAIGDRFRKN